MNCGCFEQPKSGERVNSSPSRRAKIFGQVSCTSYVYSKWLYREIRNGGVPADTDAKLRFSSVGLEVEKKDIQGVNTEGYIHYTLRDISLRH